MPIKKKTIIAGRLALSMGSGLGHAIREEEAERNEGAKAGDGIKLTGKRSISR